MARVQYYEWHFPYFVTLRVAYSSGYLEALDSAQKGFERSLKAGLIASFSALLDNFGSPYEASFRVPVTSEIIDHDVKSETHCEIRVKAMRCRLGFDEDENL